MLSRGNLSLVKTHGVNLTIALQPTVYPVGDSNAYETPADSSVLDSPPGMTTLLLSRYYRHSHAIAAFAKTAIECWESKSSKTRRLIVGHGQPGHEVLGEVPECLLLPPCDCINFCANPEEHLIRTYLLKFRGLSKHEKFAKKWQVARCK